MSLARGQPAAQQLLRSAATGGMAAAEANRRYVLDRNCTSKREKAIKVAIEEAQSIRQKFEVLANSEERAVLQQMGVSPGVVSELCPVATCKCWPGVLQ